MKSPARWFAYLPAIAWYAFIFFLSSQPKLPGPSGDMWEFVWFKTAHTLFYALLTALIWLATEIVFRPKKGLRRWYFFAVFLTVLVLAGLDELHQGLVPGRTMRSRDVLIDALASAGALLAFSRYNRRQR